MDPYWAFYQSFSSTWNFDGDSFCISWPYTPRAHIPKQSLRYWINEILWPILKVYQLNPMIGDQIKDVAGYTEFVQDT